MQLKAKVRPDHFPLTRIRWQNMSRLTRTFHYDALTVYFEALSKRSTMVWSSKLKHFQGDWISSCKIENFIRSFWMNGSKVGDFARTDHLICKLIELCLCNKSEKATISLQPRQSPVKISMTKWWNMLFSVWHPVNMMKNVCWCFVREQRKKAWNYCAVGTCRHSHRHCFDVL